MKIISIQFKNINNLKGENVISFVEEPLNSAGIFAITGPTGSGKSTLLDVITLALFNKIPRFKGSISKTSIEGLGSVVTHHMNEASASITYEIHNQKYTSTWTVGKTRTGNFKDYEMFIYDSNGTPLDLKKSEVPAKNEEIIGLKYDQFVKSIILSQGQFSKFLKADKHERGQLLENLTGSSIYRKISIAAYEKFKSVKDEVALETDRLEHIKTLSDEERSELSNQIKEHSSVKVELDVELEKLNKVKQVKQDMEKMSSTLSLKNKEREDLILEIESYKDKLKQLDIYDRLSPILGELTRYRDAQKSQEKLTSDINLNNKLLSDAMNSRSDVIDKMSNLTNQDINLDNFNTVIGAFEKEVHALNQEKLHIQQSGKERRQRINSKAVNHRIDIDPKAGPDAMLSKLQKEIEDCQSLLAKAGFESDSEAVEVSKKLDSLKEELNAMKELNLAYEQAVMSRQRVEKASVDLTGYITLEKKYAPLVTATQKLVNATRENINLLEKQREDALLIAKLSDHRNQLVDGEHCPLCGATDHPFSDHAPQQKSDLAVEIQGAKEKLNAQENEFGDYNRKLTQSLTSKKLIEDQLKIHKEELKSKAALRDAKYAGYKGADSVEEDQIGKSIEKIELKVEQVTQVSIALQNQSVLKDLVQDFDELKLILSKYTKLDHELKQKYSGEDVSKDCNVLQNQFSQYNTKIATLNTVLENDNKSLKETKEYIDTSIKVLNPQIKKLGFDTIEETTKFMISEEELRLLKSKKEELTEKSTTIDTEVKTLQENLRNSKKLDSLQTIKLIDIKQSVIEKSSKKEALIKSIGEKSAILQKDDQERERIKSKESELKKLQAKLDKWSLLNKMIGEKTGNKFANFAQGLTLQNLLVYANKRLQNLSDRYLLDKPIKDGALTVIDQYQGNIQRSVATLSGGESFLISLALALSLSDMASKNVNLESLFIDEGFGTLDQESLDIAMDTLEKLQTESQKTVGVISHVETLKERIHVQIKLDKNAQGYGTLRIEG